MTLPKVTAPVGNTSRQRPDAKCQPLQEGGMARGWTVPLHHKHRAGSTCKTNNRKCSLTL